MYDIVIIGAGVIGALIARELSKYEVNVLVIDKENDVANGTTMANSAIIHSGYDPKAGSKKALFNVQAIPLFKSLCEKLDVEFKRIGSLTVARSLEEVSQLYELEKRAQLNGVDVKILTAKEVIALEPNITPNVAGALFAPTAGIINPFELTVNAMENAIINGAKLELNQKVVAIKKEGGHFEITTNKTKFETKIIINAAGVFADEIINMVSKADFEINPRKGSYFVLDKMISPLVNTVVFPLPNPHSKGIVVVPTTSGNYLIGPTSEEIMSKEDVGTDALTLEKIKTHANLLINNIPFHKTIRTFSGLRATPSTGDFIIEHDKYVTGLINVAGIESPGLASSPSIALYVVDTLVKQLMPLYANPDFIDHIRPHIRTKNLTEKELTQMVKGNKSYATIVCSCESVSEAEIVDVLARPVPVNSIKALKKRLRVGFGLCQGGFCTPKVLKIMAKYYNLPTEAIAFDDENSYVVKEHE